MNVYRCVLRYAQRDLHHTITGKHTYITAHIYNSTYAVACAVYTCMCAQMFLYMCTGTRVCAVVYVYVRAYAVIYVHTYKYMSTHTHTQTCTHKHKRTYSHANMHTHMHSLTGARTHSHGYTHTHHPKTCPSSFACWEIPRWMTSARLLLLLQDYTYASIHINGTQAREQQAQHGQEEV